jgi:hypothetical protein
VVRANTLVAQPPRPTSTASANTFELFVENAVFLVNLLSHTIFFNPLVVPNLGPCRLPMTDRSGPRLGLIFGATLRMRVGQNNDQGRQDKYPNQNRAHGWLLFNL